MIRASAAWLSVLVLLATSLPLEAQNKSVDLAVIENRLVDSLAEMFPNWTRSEILPIEGSEDVFINKWTFDQKILGITVIRYSSEDQAAKRIRQFANDMRALPTVGEEADEQYSLMARKNSITFRKRNFVINIHVIGTDDDDGQQLLKDLTRLAIKAVKN